MTDNALLPDLERLCDDALSALSPVYDAAEYALRTAVTVDGRINADGSEEARQESTC